MAALVLGLVLTACSGGGYDFRANWFVGDEPDPASTTVDITVEAGGGCDSFLRLDVTELPDEVAIIAVGHRSDGEFCTMENELLPQTVELEAPLGERELRGCSVPGGPFLRDSLDAPVGEAECHFDPDP